MANGEIFGPFRDVPATAKVVSKGAKNLLGLPLPSLSGGPAGPSSALGGESFIGDTTLGGLKVNNTSWLNYVAIGIFGIIGLIIWKKM